RSIGHGAAIPDGNLRDEPIAMPRDRLDEPGIRSIVAELAADFLDALREGAVAHHHVIPYLLEEPSLLDEAALLAHQQHERVEVPGVEVQPFFLKPQRPVGDVEREVADAVDGGILHDAHEMLRCRSCRSRGGAAYYG